MVGSLSAFIENCQTHLLQSIAVLENVKYIELKTFIPGSIFSLSCVESDELAGNDYYWVYNYECVIPGK